MKKLPSGENENVLVTTHPFGVPPIRRNAVLTAGGMGDSCLSISCVPAPINSTCLITKCRKNIACSLGCKTYSSFTSLISDRRLSVPSRNVHCASKTYNSDPGRTHAVCVEGVPQSRTCCCATFRFLRPALLNAEPVSIEKRHRSNRLSKS